MGIHINYKVSFINSADIGLGNEEDGRGNGSVPRLTRMVNYSYMLLGEGQKIY